MKKRAVTALLTGTAAGVALMLAATAALAATLTVTVTRANPDGAVSASSGVVTFKDTRNGDTLTCSSSSVQGTVKNQTTTGAPPVKIGTTDSTFKSCTGPAGSLWTVTMSGIFHPGDTLQIAAHYTVTNPATLTVNAH